LTRPGFEPPTKTTTTTYVYVYLYDEYFVTICVNYSTINNIFTLIYKWCTMLYMKSDWNDPDNSYVYYG